MSKKQHLEFAFLEGYLHESLDIRDPTSCKANEKRSKLYPLSLDPGTIKSIIEGRMNVKKYLEKGR